MADTKIEIGDNLRSTVRDIVTLLTLLVSIWSGIKSTTASNNAGNALEETERNNKRIGNVSQEVKQARNDARKVFGLPPVPTEEQPRP